MAPPHGINAHLFKWLVASCVLDSVGAVRPFTAPAPSPTTCARTVEFEAMEQRQAAEASVAAAAIAAAIAASERAAELHAAEVVAMEERRCKVTLKIEARLSALSPTLHNYHPLMPIPICSHGTCQLCAALNASQECAPYKDAMCLTINQPFFSALICGQCLNNVDGKADYNSCFEIGGSQMEDDTP